MNHSPVLPPLLEPEQLVSAHDAPPLLIVDLCNPALYQQARVPCAVHVPPGDLLYSQPPATGKLPPLARLEALFRRIGYHPDQHIVVYDDEGGGWAGRFIWTLDLIGHQQWSYLNGGMRAWLAEGLPVDDTPVSPTPTDISLTIDESFRVSAEQIMATLGDGETLIWDARSPAEFTGERTFARRGGHMPGAVNLEWIELMNPAQNYRLRADLADFLARRGITPDKRIITHCQSHHRSGLAYLVARLLGFAVKAYDGSWSEWGNRMDTPVETA